MARSYRNGEVPSEWLVEFASGWNSADGAWVHSLPPSTYRKHLALVALAKLNRGRDLKIGVGWCAYRPLAPQIMLKKRFGIMAATPGTSSHGGFWENRQVMAIDYSNWADVYDGDRAAWFRDVRAVGLEPDLISPRRGYPDEPWHVVDLDPWAAVPSGGLDLPDIEQILEDAMANPIIDVDSTLWIARNDGTFEQYETWKAPNSRGIITHVFFGGKGSEDKIPKLNARDFEVAKTVWRQMCKGTAEAVWSHPVAAQTPAGTPAGKSFRADGFLASTNAIVNEKRLKS